MSEVPAVECHRGVPIHAFQDRQRIEEAVKREIDNAFTIADLDQLFELATNAAKSPESRLFCEAKFKATIELRARDHSKRGSERLQLLDAINAGLSELKWQSESYYCTMFDHSRARDFIHRIPPRPKEFQEALRAAKGAADAAERERARAR
jgi:hypothetical protein